MIFLSLPDFLHCIIGSRFIHFIRTDANAFLFMTNIPLYMCTTALFIHLSMDISVWG